MRHIDYEGKLPSQRTSAEWLRVGANIGNYANTHANRNDLIIFVGEGATEGIAPALFKPAIAEIEINPELAFGYGVTPEQIGDFDKRATRYEFPRATGAILHEAFHARFSLWNIAKAHEDLKQDEAEALMLLEESRIEKFGLDLDLKNRVFLRTSALELALGELNEEQLTELTIMGASKLVGLVHARVIAGILDYSEVETIIEFAKNKLGEEAFNRLSEILTEFQAYRNHFSIEGAYPLAIEWAEIVRQLQEENGEDTMPQIVPNGELSEELQDLLDEMGKAISKVGIKVEMELQDQEQQEDWQEEVENRNKQAKDQEQNQEVAEEVFDKSSGEGRGKSHSTLQEKRPPESGERRSAVTIARLLEKAKYRDRDTTQVNSEMPQGKLNVRVAIQNEAQKRQGMLPTGKAWSRKVRKQVEQPTLTVGVMVDISGSMSMAMQPMATTAWVMSEAVRRVQGRVSMVYYGEDVFPTLKAGQHLTEVEVYSATDSTEQFDKAFRALDGSLNLLYGRGARLLVVVSDGIYTDAETRKAKEWIRLCSENGVGVLWLTFDNKDYNKHYAEEICKGTNAVIVSGRINPVDASVMIGQACAKALETRKV